MGRFLCLSNWIVYGCILGLVVVYGGELRWAAAELPRYVSGHIGAPEERELVQRARRMIAEGRHTDDVRTLLERAVAIDPTCDGVFWLGELALAQGRDDEALQQFDRFLTIDRTSVAAYLRAAEILERQGRAHEARLVLARGLEYFSRNRERYWPRPNRSVDPRFNDKATEIYRSYGQATDRLTRALGGLGE